MSYVVLARKYRPKNFSQMAGQEHVVRALTHALEQGRLHHAYLFTGTRGIGKTTVSRILAKSLNCTGVDGQGGITAQPCGQCSACRDIDADRFVDYVELDAASNRSIDEIRDLIERAAYKPAVGRFKVFMIDEAHQLTKDAFNALLKTLEEPPSYLKFVLATTDPERMLPTVLSRCLQFNLRPMAPETVEDHLTSVLQQEGIEADAGAVRLLGRAARGSMRDALSLTDQAIAFGAGQVREEAVRNMLGLSGASAAQALLAALADRDGSSVIRLSQSLAAAGHSPLTQLERMAQLLQQVAIAQVDANLLDDRDPDALGVADLASRFSPQDTQLLYSIVLQGQGDLQLNSDAHAAFTMVMLRFLAFDARWDGPASATRAIRATVASTPAPMTASVAAPAKVTPATVTEDPIASVPPSVVEATRVSAQMPEVAAASTEHLTTPEVIPGPVPAEAPAVEESLAQPLAAVATDVTPVIADDTAVKPADDGALGDRWDAYVRSLATTGQLSGLLRELAWQSQWIREDGTAPERPVWWLRVPHDALRAPALRDKLQDLLRVHLHSELRLELERGEVLDSASLRDARARREAMARAESAIRDDEVVQDWLSAFPGARIVPGSIQPVAAP
jgi:DNA polymerase III subunit gamma/tau